MKLILIFVLYRVILLSISYYLNSKQIEYRIMSSNEKIKDKIKIFIIVVFLFEISFILVCIWLLGDIVEKVGYFISKYIDIIVEKVYIIIKRRE